MGTVETRIYSKQEFIEHIEINTKEVRFWSETFCHYFSVPADEAKKIIELLDWKTYEITDASFLDKSFNHIAIMGQSK